MESNTPLHVHVVQHIQCVYMHLSDLLIVGFLWLHVIKVIKRKAYCL